LHNIHDILIFVGLSPFPVTDFLHHFFFFSFLRLVLKYIVP
jgi:hypothetical protein